MCGLYGCISSLGRDSLLTETQRKKKKAILEGLMVANEQRGQDSTGIACVDYDGKTMLTKEASTASAFVATKACQSELRKNPQLVIGHTRLATTGVVNAVNAHPFVDGNIVGSHNGVVSNYLELDNKVNVDSEIIFKLLNKNDNDFVKTFKRLSGSFAISWLDLKEPSSVYLVRNDNPLNVAVVPALKTVFWSSVDYSLQTLISAVMGSKSPYSVFELKPDRVYKINKKLQITKTDITFKESFSSYYQINRDYYSNDYSKNDPKEDSLDNEDLETPYNIASEYGCEVCGNVDQSGFWYDAIKYMVVCSTHINHKKVDTNSLKWVSYKIEDKQQKLLT